MKKTDGKNNILFLCGKKRIMSMIMAIAILIISIGYVYPGAKAKASDTNKRYVTLYLKDNTKEKWVGNDDAKLVLVDNTNDHEKYEMTKLDDITWSVKVDASAYNLTFNRLNPNNDDQWNSWNAGGRDENNTYYIDGPEYGHYEYLDDQTDKFKAGDVVYLDIRKFTNWQDKEALMYVNFTKADKTQNNGNDIDINSASEEYLSLDYMDEEVEENVYKFTVTEELEGSSYLRFWRGDENTLWNNSIMLTYSDYSQGFNCVEVMGWNNSGNILRYSLRDRTTEELVKSILEYDYLIDFLTYDNYLDGIESLLNRNDTFRELSIRNDRFEVLINTYQMIQIDYECLKTGDLIDSGYIKQMFIEAYIANGIEELSLDEKNKFNNIRVSKHTEIDDDLEIPEFTSIYDNVLEEKNDDACRELYIDAEEITFDSRIISSLISVCKICGAVQNVETIRYRHKDVSVLRWVRGGYNKKEIDCINKGIIKSHPTYKKISDASGKFNCHSYAWYSTTSDTNQYWINDPKPLYLNTEYWKKSNASSNLKKDYRVILFDSKGLVHSVIMVSSTKCVSKLGHGGVYITTLKEIKKQYNAKNIQVYIPVK